MKTQNKMDVAAAPEKTELSFNKIIDENPDDIIQIENPDLNINNLSEQEILDYLLYHRNWLVLPSNTKKNFEDMFYMNLSGQKWKKFVKEITWEWNNNCDENFVNDFMELLVSKSNWYWD